MTMTPQDIQTQKFRVKFRGYDADEVDSFLEDVAEDFLDLIQKSKKIGEQVDELKKSNAALLSEEKSFKAAMLSAQKVADEIKAKSKADSESLLSETSEKIKQMKHEANTKIARLKAEIEELEKMKAAIREELHVTLQTYKERLGPEEKADKTKKAVVAPVAAKAETAKVKEPKKEELSEEDVADLYQKVGLPEENKGAAPEKKSFVKKSPAGEAEIDGDDSDTFDFPDDDEDDGNSMPGTKKGDLGEKDLKDLFQETEESRARFEDAPDPFAKKIADDSDIFEFPDEDEEELKEKKN